MSPSQNPSVPASQPPATGSNSFATKLLAVLLVLLIIVIGYILVRPAPNTTTPAPTSANVAPAAVSISATGFSPATVSIRKGQAVTWTNTDANPHGITSSASGSSSFKSQNLTQNDTYSFIFSTAGTYTYHDSLNPTTLSGMVVVK